MSGRFQIFDSTQDESPVQYQPSYPDVGQSWGIVGWGILAQIIFAPILILSGILTSELVNLIYYCAAMGALLWFINRRRQRFTGSSKFYFEAFSFKALLLIIIGTLPLIAGFISPVSDLIPMPDFLKDIFINELGGSDLSTFLVVVIAAPVLEEFIFRGVMLDGLLKNYTPKQSILFSAFLFGIIHMNPWQFIAAFALGVFAGWIYFRTRNLLLAIAVHMVNNLLGFLQFYFMDAEKLMDTRLIDLYGGWSNYIAIIVVSLGLFWACVSLLNKEFSKFRITPFEREAAPALPMDIPAEDNLLENPQEEEDKF